MNLTDTTPHKTPHHMDAERGVLYAMLKSESASLYAVERLCADQFYHPPHRVIFQALRDMTVAGEDIDATMLAERLKRRQELEIAGGVFYLGDILTAESTTTNVSSYAAVVERNAKLRTIIRQSMEAIEAAEKLEDPDAIAERMIGQCFQMGADTRDREVRHISEGVREYFDEQAKIDTGGRRRRGVPTQIPLFNSLTNGMHPGEMIVLGARPGVGKSAFALNTAVKAAKGGWNVMFFSLEMPLKQLTERLLSMEGKVPHGRVRTHTLTKGDFQAVQGTKVEGLSLWTFCRPGLTPVELVAKVRHHRVRHEVGLVIIDYLQRMRSGERFQGKYTEVSLISERVKDAALTLDVPILIPAQLSRPGKTDKGAVNDRRPNLTDLRDSGQIEQDADVVAFLHRGERKGVTGWDDDTDTAGANVPFFELIIEKQRNGPRGVIPLNFDGAHQAFTEGTDQEPPPDCEPWTPMDDYKEAEAEPPKVDEPEPSAGGPSQDDDLPF